MSQQITVDQFDRLYETFEHTVWRWEAQPSYHEPGEAEPFRRWLAGEPDDMTWLAEWLESVRVACDAGRRFDRVRVVHDPPTDYQRWGFDVAPANIAAGEDIRVLPVAVARDLGMPEYDFCFLDDRVVARMHFGSEGMTGAELIEETGEVERHRAWRDAAWQHAVPFDEHRVRYLTEWST